MNAPWAKWLIQITSSRGCEVYELLVSENGVRRDMGTIIHHQRIGRKFWLPPMVVAVGVLVTVAATVAAERIYPMGTPTARIDIRDAKVKDFSSRREMATLYIQLRASARDSSEGYYEGPSLLRNCLERNWSLSEACRNSLDLELAGLDFTVGVGCVEAQGLKRREDMQSLLRRFDREFPSESKESGDLVGIMAFLKYADPQRCPESAEAAAARAEREKRAARAASGDAEEQYQLGLRTYGEERAYWLCFAANKGHAAAQYEYGKYFETYEDDAVSAYRWYLLSKRGGYWQSPEAANRLEGSLSSTEIAKAKGLSEHWNPEDCRK